MCKIAYNVQKTYGVQRVSPCVVDAVFKICDGVSPCVVATVCKMSRLTVLKVYDGVQTAQFEILLYVYANCFLL